MFYHHRQWLLRFYFRLSHIFSKKFALFHRYLSIILKNFHILFNLKTGTKGAWEWEIFLTSNELWYSSSFSGIQHIHTQTYFTYCTNTCHHHCIYTFYLWQWIKNRLANTIYVCRYLFVWAFTCLLFFWKWPLSFSNFTSLRSNSTSHS